MEGKQVGRRKRSRMLPRRESEVRVERSSERHLRQVRELELRVRTSSMKEKV